MKRIKAKYEILQKDIFDGMNERIEMAARECYQSSHVIAEGTADKFVARLMKDQHQAMIEHGGLISVRLTVDRGVTHEVVRHRIASFAQESTRYCNYSQDRFNDEITYVDIYDGIKLDNSMKCVSDIAIAAIITEWISACEDAERHYLNLIDLGASPQIARSVLNNSTKSSITVSANPREWYCILELRAALCAHPQMREIMIPLGKELALLNPVVFGDFK